MQVAKQALVQPAVTPVSDPPDIRYRLDEGYTYQWDHEEGRDQLVIPQGFEYDGASVPRAVWTLTEILPDGLIRAAALVHDFIYDHGGNLPEGSHRRFNEQEGRWDPVDRRWSRAEADDLFLKIMIETGIQPWKCVAAYKAVHHLGEGHWGVTDTGLKRHLRAIQVTKDDIFNRIASRSQVLKLD